VEKVGVPLINFHAALRGFAHVHRDGRTSHPCSSAWLWRLHSVAHCRELLLIGGSAGAMGRASRRPWVRWSMLTEAITGRARG
jgi:hypothetical protein